MRRFNPTRQHHPLHVIAVFALLLLVSSVSVAAGEPESKPLDARPAPRSLVSLTDAEAAQLPPFKRELRLVQLRERAVLGELTSKLSKTTTDAEAMRLQREIAVVKQQAEIDIMDIQANHAAASGHPERAESIRSALADLRVRVEELRQELGIDQ